MLHIHTHYQLHPVGGGVFTEMCGDLLWPVQGVLHTHTHTTNRNLWVAACLLWCVVDSKLRNADGVVVYLTSAL